jgi:omega-6 fatty acid desaturase (delta-12 desaturase)
MPEMDATSEPSTRRFGKIMAPYTRPSPWRSWWQIVNTIPPLCGLWYLAWLSLEISYALTLVCAALCIGFFVRITIFQHDCGHYAFFRSRWANEAMGHVCTIFNLTPFCFWLHHHAEHHTKINCLDRAPRSIFSECLTVREYYALPWHARVAYRVLHHPLTFYPLVTPLMLAIGTRFPLGLDKSAKAARFNVYIADAVLIAFYALLGTTFGWVEVAMVQLPILVMGSAVGLWLDSLGHKFHTSSWVRSDEWNLSRVAMNGAGYFKPPKILQWLSGNIGIHHIHHLNPRIPNYNLQRCHDENAEFHSAKVFGLWEGITSAWLVLWDDQRGRLITFAELPPRETPPLIEAAV